MDGCKLKPGNMVASAWISIVTSVKLLTTAGRGQVLHNERRHAMASLRESITEVQRCEDETAIGLRTIATQVKTVNTKNKAPLRELLTRSRTQRQKLTLITKKRVSLQTHLETLETSELNQQVISSVKETSLVLKSMGLNQNMETVDELMMDMAESHEDVQNIQEGLSAQRGDSLEQTDLDSEFELLMQEDSDFDAPPQDNSMNSPMQQPVVLQVKPVQPHARVTPEKVAAVTLSQPSSLQSVPEEVANEATNAELADT